MSSDGIFVEVVHSAHSERIAEMPSTENAQSAVRVKRRSYPVDTHQSSMSQHVEMVTRPFKKWKHPMVLPVKRRQHQNVNLADVQTDPIEENVLILEDLLDPSVEGPVLTLEDLLETAGGYQPITVEDVKEGRYQILASPRVARGQ